VPLYSTIWPSDFLGKIPPSGRDIELEICVKGNGEQASISGETHILLLRRDVEGAYLIINHPLFTLSVEFGLDAVDTPVKIRFVSVCSRGLLISGCNKI